MLMLSAKKPAAESPFDYMIYLYPDNHNRWYFQLQEKLEKLKLLWICY